MTSAFALAQATIRSAPTEGMRLLLVAGCGLALIFARQPFPF